MGEVPGLPPCLAMDPLPISIAWHHPRGWPPHPRLGPMKGRGPISAGERSGGEYTRVDNDRQQIDKMGIAPLRKADLFILTAQSRPIPHPLAP